MARPAPAQPPTRVIRMDSELLFGTSPAMAKVLVACRKYAVAIAPVLILGDTGVGKTVLARHLHALSGRSGAFDSQSLASIPEHLEASTLRGHTRGAFTGADRDMPGIIEAARGGTLLLDEIGLASPAIQQVLLDLIEDRAVKRVGEVRARPVDTWFIGATNVDLTQAVADGDFRRDLLARFGYLRIHLPPLAERRDEILPLVRTNLARQSARLAQPVPHLSKALEKLLLDAPWRDNIRQVESVCQHLVIHAELDRPLEPGDLPRDFLVEVGLTKELRVSRIGPETVRWAIKTHGGNRSQAALTLGITRRHLQRLLARPRASA